MTTHRDLCKLNFLVTSDKLGRRYVRGYKNVWSPATATHPGRSKMGTQVYVGALKENYLVKMSRGFLQKYPQFSGKEWFYEDNIIYDESSFKALHPESLINEKTEINSSDINEEKTESDDSKQKTFKPMFKHFGFTYGITSMSMDSGILKSLKNVLEGTNSFHLHNFAMYGMTEKPSADGFEDWAKERYLPYGSELSGQRISEVFASVTPEKMDLYFAERYEHSKKRQLENNQKKLYFCALDSTSISSYSKANHHAEFGKAKRDDDIPQVNVVFVMDQITGEIIYACEYSGSVNDVSSLVYVCQRMSDIGIDLSEIIFVMDRGYSSVFNQNKLLDYNSNFVLASPIVPKSKVWNFIMNEQIDSSKNLFNSNTLVPHTGLNMCTLKEAWKNSNRGTFNTYVHIFRDSVKASQENVNLRALVQSVADRANKYPDRNYKNDPGWCEAQPYLSQIEIKTNGEHQKGKMIWVSNNEKLSQKERLNGCFVIRSSIIEDPVQALEIYRSRNIVEVAFRCLKNQISDRFFTSKTGYYGKFLASLLGLSYHMMIRSNAAKQPMVDGKVVCLPSNSVPRLLIKLDNIHISKVRADRRWLVDKLTRQQRTYFSEFLNVKVPPLQL